MSTPTDLLEALKSYFKEDILEATLEKEELTLEVKHTQLHSMCVALRHESPFSFETLIDICGVDYQEYGIGEWTTESATSTGFDRATTLKDTHNNPNWRKPRFAAVYHLLSLKYNHRLRLRAFANIEADASGSEIEPTLESVSDIWPSANWYEREAFDLYGIQFKGHPDQRRLLTDYDFEGHPFRKDFPLSGRVEVRYDAKAEKVIYEPVTSVIPRTVIPKVTRSKTEPNTDLSRTTQEEC